MSSSHKGRALLSTGFTDGVLLAVSVFTGVITARLLGPTGRGEFALIVLAPSLIAAVGSLGIREAIVYRVSRTTESRPELICAAIILGCSLSVFLIPLAWLLFPVFKITGTSFERAAFAYSLYIPLNLVGTFLIGALQGAQRFVVFNVARASVSVGFLAFVGFLWLTSKVDPINVAMALLISNLLTTILAATLCIQRMGIRIPNGTGLLAGVLTYGMRNHLGTVSNLLNRRLDQVILAALVEPMYLGLYVVAVSASSIVESPSRTVAAVLFPRVARSPRHAREELAQFGQISLTCSLFLTFAGMIAIPVLLPIFYGPEYRASVAPALLLTVASMFVAIGLVWSSVFRGLGRPEIPSQSEGIALLFTVVVMPFLVHRYGILGAAMSSLLAYSIAASYLFYRLHRAFGKRAVAFLKPHSPYGLWALLRRRSNSV